MNQWSTFNPTTGELLSEYNYCTSEEIESGIRLLEKEFQRFKRIPVSERCSSILNLATLIRKNKLSLAQDFAKEMGKPLKQGIQELEKCALACEYFAEIGDPILISEELRAQYDRTWLVKRPLGVILAIMPWNFPFWQVIRCAVPAIMSGNVVLLKHAPQVQKSARKLQELFQESFGCSVLIQLPLSNDQVAQVIADSRLRMVSFTGSTETGRIIASLAGAHLKKCILELGGSDAYIVLEDADIDLAARKCVNSRFINSGQSCIAAKRFFIHQSIYSEFKSKIIELIKKLNVGDPLLETTEIGPLVDERIKNQVSRQIKESLEMGAQYGFRLTLPDNIDQSKGFFMEPTIVENVTLEMPLMKEECFGPIMPLMPISSLEHGVSLVNQSRYGLGAVLFTRSLKNIWGTVLEDLDVGMVSINEMIQSDPRAPFGGVKDSGFGRELGRQGMIEFINQKIIGLSGHL